MSHRQRKADTCQEDGRRYSDSTSPPESNATRKARAPSSVGDQETQRPRIERTEAGNNLYVRWLTGDRLNNSYTLHAPISMNMATLQSCYSKK
jgi:hypothetical protein